MMEKLNSEIDRLNRMLLKTVMCFHPGLSQASTAIKLLFSSGPRGYMYYVDLGRDRLHAPIPLPLLVPSRALLSTFFVRVINFIHCFSCTKGRNLYCTCSTTCSGIHFVAGVTL